MNIDSLSGNDITSNGATLLFDMLKGCPAVSTIYLNKNNLDDKCMHSMGQLIKERGAIKSISLWNNQLTNEAIFILEPYLKGNRRLKDINFSCNKGITDASYNVLLDVIFNTGLDDIFLMGTMVTTKIHLFPSLVRTLGPKTETFSVTQRYVFVFYSKMDVWMKKYIYKQGL